MLKRAHPVLARWFNEHVWPRYPQAHISCSWRDERTQNEAYARGASRARWPHSRHNRRDEEGNPCSWALDLFRYDAQGASWPVKFYATIAESSQAEGWPVEWGGAWVKFPDSPHFQLPAGFDMGDLPPRLVRAAMDGGTPT